MDGSYYQEDAEYYEDDENEDYEDDEVEFDASNYVDKTDISEENVEEKDDDFASEASTYQCEQDEDPLDLEEKLKRLEEVFPCFPRVLIKRILNRDDVEGDLTKASARLQDFQDMDSPQDYFKPPAVSQPKARDVRGGPSDPRSNRPVNTSGNCFQELEGQNAGDIQMREGQTPELDDEVAMTEPTEKKPLMSCPIDPNENTKKKKNRRRNRGKGKDMQREQEASFEGGAERSRGYGSFSGEALEGGMNRGYEGRARGGYTGRPRGGPRGGIAGSQDNRRRYNQEGWDGGGEGFRGNQMGQNSNQMGFGPQEWGYGGSGAESSFQAERGRGSRGRRGSQEWGYGGPGAESGFQAERWRGNRGGRGSQEWGYGGPGAESGFQPERGRGSRGYQRKPRGQDIRGRGRGFQGRPYPTPQQQHLPSARGARGGQGFQERGRGRGFRGRNNFPGANLVDRSAQQGTSESSEYQNRRGKRRSKESLDDSDVGRFRGNESYRSGEGAKGRSGQGTPRDDEGGRGQGDMTRAQSMLNISQSFDEHRSGDTHGEEDDTLFELNKLLVSGLSEKTTDDGVLNFIEAMSGEEVKEVSMLGKGKALVTMTDDITNFSRIKEKGEKRGLDSAKVSVKRAPVCRRMLVSGIPPQTTHDSIELYFESRRNRGGPVERVEFEPGSDRAVVIFENPKDMERIVAQQQEQPHVLNKVPVSVRIFPDFLTIDDVIDDQSDDPLESSSSAPKTSAAQESTGQQLHIAVDPDIMDFIMTSAHQDELNSSLAEKKSELKWKPAAKLAVILYRGEYEGDSWQTECIDEVQSFLGKFGKCDVQVKKEFWKAVVAQIDSIRACLGDEPPLVKSIDGSLVVRIVSLGSEVKTCEEKVKAKLEEIYCEETRKTYLKKKIPKVSEEMIVLLQKIKFAEKLQMKNKELVIKLDGETEEVYFEGPQPQFTEATMKFHKLRSDMVEKKLTLTSGILEVLASDYGMKKVKEELEANNVEAVFVVDEEAKIVGTSTAHADKTNALINKLILEEKVRVDDSSLSLLKTTEWRDLCEQINKTQRVRIHRNNWNDTWVAGFRSDVTESMAKLQEFLDENCEREEEFMCPSTNVRRYLSELRQIDIQSLEDTLKAFNVQVQKGKDGNSFTMSGKKEGLKRARKRLGALLASIESTAFEVEQPGLRKYFTSGKGDRLVKSVEKDQECVIQVDSNFHSKRANDHEVEEEATAVTGDGDSTDSDDDFAHVDINPSVWVSPHGHKVSWKPGNIVAEQAHTLVSSHGACAKAIMAAAGAAMANISGTPKTGEIVVSPRYNLTTCSHVIHTTCCPWNGSGGSGEATLRAIVQKCLQKVEELGGDSIAFPVIGAGQLKFPPDVASKIMLEETVSFCQTHQSSKVKDIRFVVFQQDQNLIAAFEQEMKNVQAKHKGTSASKGGVFRNLFRSLMGLGSSTLGGHHVQIEVIQGDLTKEQTDAIVNMNSKDMNMNNAGELSKAVAKAGGQQLETECRQLGQQHGGTAVMTSGGNLGVRHIIHLIPDSKDKQHLQNCLEKCLGLAEAKGLQSISLPAIGTGAFGLSAADSASLTFQALSNVCGSGFVSIRKVRVVIFQPQMLQTFLQEKQKLTTLSTSKGPTVRSTNKSRLSIEIVNADLTKEQTDAIVNINSTDMNMNNAGELGKAVAQAAGQQVQDECTQLGQQPGGTVVMTSGGMLAARHIIHMVPGSPDSQHLQTCLEGCLQHAETKGLQTISLPAVGTGEFNVSAADSARLTFQALNKFSASCKNVRKVRIVVFKAQMVQAFQQEQQKHGVHSRDEEDVEQASAARQSRKQGRSGRNPTATKRKSVKISVTGKGKAVVSRAVDALKKGFSEACTTEKVENEVVSKLSERQVGVLQRKAQARDVKLEIEADVDRIVVRGEPSEVSGMVGEIWQEISERTKKDRDREQAQLVSRNIEWSYERHGNTMPFDPKTNAKIELAHTKNEPNVRVSLRAEEFVIDLNANTGRGQQSGDQITLSRKVKGADEGIPLPKHWAPMPQNTTVHTVLLSSGSNEYQDVVRKVQATGGAVNIQKIERIQNPHLHRSYMVKKQKMDKDNGGTNERQLFHGTDGKNIAAINTQGFNRSFCGVHGTAYGRGVYFARDASYSMGYAGSGGGGGRYMYLARVLVGQFCAGNQAMIVPPPKNASKPEILYDSVVNQIANPGIFVVFFDYQCYPEYLITF